MKNLDTIIKSAITALLTFTATGTVIASGNACSPPTMEKCYGIVKAGMNDCATTHSSCSGSVTKNNQTDAFLMMPKGLCDKIVGGVAKPFDGSM